MLYFNNALDIPSFSRYTSTIHYLFNSSRLLVSILADPSVGTIKAILYPRHNLKLTLILTHMYMIYDVVSPYIKAYVHYILYIYLYDALSSALTNLKRHNLFDLLKRFKSLVYSSHIN